jgi:hypothetical protein
VERSESINSVIYNKRTSRHSGNHEYRKIRKRYLSTKNCTDQSSRLIRRSTQVSLQILNEITVLPSRIPSNKTSTEKLSEYKCTVHSPSRQCSFSTTWPRRNWFAILQYYYINHTSISSPPTHGLTAPSGPRPPHCRGFTITLRHTTFGRAHLDEGPASRRDLYLTTHNTHKRHTPMPPAGFEPAIPADPRLSSRGHRYRPTQVIQSIIRYCCITTNNLIAVIYDFWFLSCPEPSPMPSNVPAGQLYPLTD